VSRAGEESYEVFVVGASDPIEDASIIFTQVNRPFEHHGPADQTAFHLDGVFVRTSAIAFKDSFPDIAFTLYPGVELLADLHGRGTSLRRMVHAPGTGPHPVHVRGGISGLIFVVSGLGVLGLGKRHANARDQYETEQG